MHASPGLRGAGTATNEWIQERLNRPWNVIPVVVFVCLWSVVPSMCLAQSPRQTPSRTGAPPTERRTYTNNTRTTNAKVPAAPKPQALWIGCDPEDPSSQRVGDCYFRRMMDLPEIEKSFVDVESPLGSEVYFNGRRVRTIKSEGGKERIELQGMVRPGKNLLAIRVLNRESAMAGLRAEFFFKPIKGNWRVVVSDSEWLANKMPSVNWQTVGFNDRGWRPAVDLASDLQPNRESAKGDAQRTRPFLTSSSEASAESSRIDSQVADASIENETADDQRFDESKSSVPKVVVSNAVGKSSNDKATDAIAAKLKSRFTIPPGFAIEQIADSSLGSLLAMTFNEFGHIIASVEGGGLVLIYDTDRDGIPDKSRNYCDLVGNVQGILALNGDVYVTGEGSEGQGLYRLIDSDRNGELEKSELLAAFEGVPGEHGAHQIAFGPDGFLYISMGNHVRIPRDPDVLQSYAPPYEGDLVQPRFEDPGGHASGVKAPGGTVMRYDLAGRTLSMVAGGLRNAYDLAFHPSGALYLQDSDMEADIGAVWHRPTGLFRIVEGGEYGWRSGWANWPDYYLDRLPSQADTGRGSPTGITVYNHFTFPSRYHRSVFTADWSEGRIIALQIDTAETGRVKAEDFVVGTPMNVTDLEVGPDGGLYFSTGGRGTEGGIFRVQWTGEIPESLKNLGEGISKAIRQPQLYSAYARQAVAILKREMGEQWDSQVVGVAFSEENPARYRMQALDLMQLLGPIPTTEVLIDLSKTGNESVRAKCARFLGLHGDDPAATDRLRRLVQDSSAVVRTAACESLVRTAAICELSELEGLLASESREERYFGRRLLQNAPIDAWGNQLMQGKPRVAINAYLASVVSDPSTENCTLVVEGLLKTARGFVSDAEFLDLLRTLQIALAQGKIQPGAIAELPAFIEREFPTGNSTVNGELIRLATYLQCDLVPQCVQYLKTDTSMPDRMLIAMHLPLMKHEWTSAERMAVYQFLETCLKEKSGGSYALYVMKTSEELSRHLTERESIQILELGQRYPNAALSALFKLSDDLTLEQIEMLKRLDASIDRGGLEEDVFKRLKTGITAVLSQQKDDSAMEYLRQRWRKSPDRRASIALAMSLQPNDANWDYLVRSMGVLDLFAVPDVCNALMKIDAATEDPEVIRQTILQGCRLVEAGQDPMATLQLLEYWTGAKPQVDASEDSKESETTPMTAWQQWFAVQYPNSPDAVLPSETAQPRWSLSFLDQFLNGEQSKEGSSEAGSLVFAKARCSACHRMNTQGGGYGPDLTSINRRFTRNETLESILFPSHVISDQYATKKLITKTGEVYTGIVVKTAKGIAIRVNENKEFVIADEEIDEMAPSKSSAMPAGLLDELTPTEIRDLMCYLGYVPVETLAQEKPVTVRR